MTDDRFFTRCGPFSLGVLAACSKADLAEGASTAVLLRGIAPLETAEADDVSVFCDARRADAFAVSRAGAIITSAKLAAHRHDCANLLIARDPRFAFAAVGLMFHPRCTDTAGISGTADIHATASVGEGCRIDSGVVVGAHAHIGEGCHLGANCVIGDGVEIGPQSVIGCNATVSHALIGAGVRIGAGTVIGGEGFGVVLGPAGLMCSAQVGRVIIGDNVRIGGNCTIDRGALDDTVIGSGTMLDNLIQIAHNVRIGRNCIFAGQSGVAGSAIIGDNVMVGGAVSISDHLTIGSNVRIAGKSGVAQDVADGAVVGGYPAVPVRQWHRQNLALAAMIKKPGTDA
ncbi:UDP-3-O-(3-hydroxymyristoyl)glucosamine N-acyltransferase [Rhizomicrobium electricum]|uniref:UDP-3-O-acylglucosamine N-acyltransferase n=1 Tax=Rhizomicrobium electricum TaxID=480070 RepID=A0ABN1F0W8_9PROT|nr:UDP-3-O-(3-hydroxymyristoyl)glucosamine N-acyltransferase [Rhizomicrobium electricum]